MNAATMRVCANCAVRLALVTSGKPVPEDHPACRSTSPPCLPKPNVWQRVRAIA